MRPHCVGSTCPGWYICPGKDHGTCDTLFDPRKGVYAFPLEERLRRGVA